LQIKKRNGRLTPTKKNLLFGGISSCATSPRGSNVAFHMSRCFQDVTFVSSILPKDCFALFSEFVGHLGRRMALYCLLRASNLTPRSPSIPRRVVQADSQVLGSNHHNERQRQHPASIAMVHERRHSRKERSRTTGTTH
jgi:hypothetical protein